MKSHTISVSRHGLTRCESCERHHRIDQTLDAVQLWKLTCDFCGGQILKVDMRHDDHVNAVPQNSQEKLFGVTSSKIALGLLGASLSMTACDDDETVNRCSAGVDLILAEDDLAYAGYGAFLAEEFPEPGGTLCGTLARNTASDTADCR